MMNTRRAFTMIELIFVIVVLGILAAVAIPRFGSTVKDSYLAKARSDISAIRSAIVSERQARLLQGTVTYIGQLDDATIGADGETLFDGNGTNLLQYGVISLAGDGHWIKTATGYNFKVEGTNVPFTYDNTTGRFTCDRNAGGDVQTYCRRMID